MIEFKLHLGKLFELKSQKATELNFTLNYKRMMQGPRSWFTQVNVW